MRFDWRKLVRDKRAWAVAAIGGVLGLAAAAKAKKQGSSAGGGVDPAAGPYVGMQGGTYDRSLQDIWEGFNQTAYDLQEQITGIQTQLDADTPPPVVNDGGPAKPAKPFEGWHGTKEYAGKTIRQVAAMFARKPSDPNSVEATVRELGKRNPWLKGRGGGNYRLKAGQILVVPKKGS